MAEIGDNVYIDSWNYLKAFAEEVEVDTANNRSKVKYGLNIHVTSGGHVESYTFDVKLRGQDYYIGYAYYGSGVYTLAQRTEWIPHESDGSGAASINWEFSASINGNNVYKSGSTDYPLTKINRSFTSTPQITNTSKTAHSLTFSWTTSENCSKIIASVNGTGSQVWTGNAKSGTFTVNNLTPDTSYLVFGDFTRQDTGVTRISNKVTVKTKKVPTRIRVNGVWKEAMPYVRVNGVWKEAKPYVRVNNQWKEGI
jgi:hypothetical protein